ncbi:MAG TPA: prepilin-type N-terminal cleavage/methylation domain-containing protein [Gemmatimonadaceae bacterium]|nr:prepilin-type N-terminal cleavage/methylation domain-containing protein [Gemmatimonadaceae bacterium]
MPRRRSGFTLIELLIVVVIIGVLASIAVPKFRNTKGKALAASIKSDLRNLATAQEAYFYDHSTYATDETLLNYHHSPGVVTEVVTATTQGWSASAHHPAADPLTCGIAFGNEANPIAPGTAEGAIGCTILP